MPDNPYTYKGPLDPVNNRLILVPRADELKRVTDGIKKGEYWIILGIRQIGKTTFLRQIMKKIKSAHHVYIDFEVPPKSEKNFYQWIMKKILEEIPCEQGEKLLRQWKNYDPAFRFVNFLENFVPKNDKKKIVLLLDEIEGIPFLSGFLSIWRKIHQERNAKIQLKKYSVILAGSFAPVTSTVSGDNSTFDAAEIYYIKDFSREESEGLIDKPLKRLNIKIEPGAKDKLISLISGHPQMLQQACHTMVDIAVKEKRMILEKDIDAAIGLLLIKNTTIDTLKEDIQENVKLKKLVRAILEGKRKKYYPYKKFSITGAGCIIVDENSFCAIRNKVYEQFFRDSPDIEITGLSDTERIPFADEKLLNNNAVNKYRIHGVIGKGGMGEVVKAEDLTLDRLVAIKTLDKKSLKRRNDFERFKREARLPAKLSHPNIVTVFEFIIGDNDCLLVLEFIDGPNLKDLMKNGGPFTPLQIIYIAKKISEALAYLHKNKIIHRDIKPKNIMLTPEGKIKLVDFGVAVIKEDKATGDTGFILGTHQYMAPEQFYGERAHYFSDIYSTGITLFHLAAGNVPFDAIKFEYLREQHLKKPLPSLADFRNDIDHEFEEIIKKCAAKDPKDRFQSAQELLDTINLNWKSIDEAAIENELKKMIRE